MMKVGKYQIDLTEGEAEEAMRGLQTIPEAFCKGYQTGTNRRLRKTGKREIEEIEKRWVGRKGTSMRKPFQHEEDIKTLLSHIHALEEER